MVTIYWDIKIDKCHKYMIAKNKVENFNSCLYLEVVILWIIWGHDISVSEEEASWKVPF